MKKLAVLLLAVLSLTPTSLQATAQTPEDFIPRDTMFHIDLQLNGKLKELMLPFIEMILSNNSNTQIMLDQMKAGERFVMGVTPQGPGEQSPSEGIAFFPVSGQQWQLLQEGTTEISYDDNRIYQDGTEFLTKIEGYAVSGSSQAILEKALDLANGKSIESLNSDPDFRNTVSEQIPGRILGFSFNIASMMKLMGNEFPALPMQIYGDPGFNVLEKTLGLFSYMGVSLGESPNGYSFTINITGNTEKLTEAGLSMNPGGNFVPNLYKSLPDLPLLAYSESFNLKAQNESDKKMGQYMLGSMFDTFQEKIYGELPFDIDALKSLFDKEVAFAVQYDSANPWPIVTFLGNVSDSKEAAAQSMAILISAAENFLKEKNVLYIAKRSSNGGNFTTFTLDLKQIAGYDGPSGLPPLEITAGITDNGLLIVSNYPGIEKAETRIGVNSDEYFSAYTEIIEENIGILFLGARTLWNWVDNGLTWLAQQEHRFGTDLSFYQDYYSLLEKIYPFKSLMLISTATETSIAVAGTVGIDGVRHETYNDFITKQTSSDSDSDGINDYEERYLYYTSPQVSDCDSDGTYDIDELEKGNDPCGKGRLFSDLPENTYYTDEISYMYQRGAMDGYPDGTARPNNTIRRAEFAQMIAKAFGYERKKNTVPLGTGTQFYYASFQDVPDNQWYTNAIERLYEKGIVSGSEDGLGNRFFRPGDMLTRAEATTILNKASTLKDSLDMISCADSPFTDVKPSDWFCEEIANAYNNGVVKGKTKKLFDPHAAITRAEAAIMIRRTLEKDSEYRASPRLPQSPFVLPLFQKALPSLVPSLN